MQPIYGGKIRMKVASSKLNGHLIYLLFFMISDNDEYVPTIAATMPRPRTTTLRNTWLQLGKIKWFN